ncbi:MAG: aldo/keto reductase [Anaerolineaceae bacterium]|nr:aldo/keto reductase [Anaerolineaceae bacterium]
MQYRKFGKLDWQVSALGFGAMRLPTIDGVSGNIDQEKTAEMIHTAIEGGVNYFDTAYVYHDQKSEAALGKALQNGLRDKVRIASKSAIWLLNDGDGFQRMLDEQLERLQTDHIDFYLLHALSRNSFENKVQKLDLIKESEKAIADGRIKHIGFSFHDNLDVFKEIIDFYDKWDFCQIQYNYMDTEFQAGREGLKYAAEKDIAARRQIGPGSTGYTPYLGSRT